MYSKLDPHSHGTIRECEIAFMFQQLKGIVWGIEIDRIENFDRMLHSEKEVNITYFKEAVTKIVI